MLTNLIVPVLNRYDLLNRMLSTIDYPIKHLLIIDNGGELQFLEQPKLVEQVTVLNMPSNLGVAESWNLGIKLFPHDERWFITSNDMWYQPGDLEIMDSQAGKDALTLSNHYPYFHTFVLGESVVESVGLFDGRLYPAYFEDTDYIRRCEAANVPIRSLDVGRGHDNSSTLNSDARFQGRNHDTFQRNRQFFDSKLRSNDLSWSWSLASRRAGEWLR